VNLSALSKTLARRYPTTQVSLQTGSIDERKTVQGSPLTLSLWSEIPVYWAVQFDNPALLVKAEQQLIEMIGATGTKRPLCRGP
jgi:hypothetical protein